MAFTLDRLTYPVDMAVTDTEVKRYLLLKNLPTDVSLDLTEQIKEAIDQVEGWTRRSLMPANFKLSLDCWPDDCVITLDRSPLIDVVLVQYRNETTGNWTPMTKNVDYRVDKESRPGRIILLNTPSLFLDDLTKVQVIFQSGHTHTSSVPPRAKKAVKLLVASSFEDRKDQMVKGMSRAEAICRSIAIRTF